MQAGDDRALKLWQYAQCAIEIVVGGEQVGRDDCRDRGAKCGLQPVCGIFEGQAFGGGQAQRLQRLTIHLRVGFLAGCGAGVFDHLETLRPVWPQAWPQQRVDTGFGGGGDNGLNVLMNWPHPARHGRDMAKERVDDEAPQADGRSAGR